MEGLPVIEIYVNDRYDVIPDLMEISPYAVAILLLRVLRAKYDYGPNDDTTIKWLDVLHPDEYDLANAFVDGRLGSLFLFKNEEYFDLDLVAKCVIDREYTNLFPLLDPLDERHVNFINKIHMYVRENYDKLGLVKILYYLRIVYNYEWDTDPARETIIKTWNQLKDNNTLILDVHRNLTDYWKLPKVPASEMKEELEALFRSI